MSEYRITHNLSKHKLYRVWHDMKDRCYRKNNSDYKDYGGRGITVCKEWLNDFQKFYDWAINKWQKRLIFDRINVNGNYEPNNCRFVTPEISANNTRSNIKIVAFGETKTISQWSEDERCKVKYDTLLHRIKSNKWINEKAISQQEYKYITIFGECKTIIEWCKDTRCKVKYTTFYNRIYKYKWNPEKAILTPNMRKK